MSKSKILFNMVIEFGPILTFIVLSEVLDFITATLVFVCLTILALIAVYIDRRKLAPFPTLVSIVVVITGLITVKFNNPEVFIFETTFYNAACALAVIVSLHFKKPLFKVLFQDTFTMTDRGWTILTKRWGYMFVALAISNEFVRYNFSPEGWVRYKFFITIVSTLFGTYQFLTLRKRSD
jgi:intracellular septation protein